MLRIELKEDCPGYALFTASKWKGNTEVEISVQRNQDARYFAGQNEWNPEPVWHKISDFTLDGEILQGRIGPWLIDGLVQQIGNAYRLSVRDSAGNQDLGAVKMTGNILASSAGGNTAREDEVKEHQNPEPEPVITPEPVIEPTSSPEIEPVVEPEPVPQPEPVMRTTATEAPQKKSKTGLIIGLIVLLLAIAAGAFFFLNQSDKPEEKTEAAPCTLASNQGDELALIQGCLKSNPAPQQILSMIDEAKNANKCTIAQRLYANQAQGGNVEIALAYASEYEKGSQCFEADKSTAIYWYETALANDPDNAVAKQKLEELKK